MAWLKQSVTAGFKDALRLQKEEDLAAVRDREDFKTLVATLEKRPQKK